MVVDVHGVTVQALGLACCPHVRLKVLRSLALATIRRAVQSLHELCDVRHNVVLIERAVQQRGGGGQKANENDISIKAECLLAKQNQSYRMVPPICPVVPLTTGKIVGSLADLIALFQSTDLAMSSARLCSSPPK